MFISGKQNRVVVLGCAAVLVALCAACSSAWVLPRQKALVRRLGGDEVFTILGGADTVHAALIDRELGTQERI